MISPKLGPCQVVQIHGKSEKNLNGSKCIGVFKNQDMNFLLDMITKNNLQHVVQENNLDIQSELNSSALMINHCDSFMKFPVSSVLDPENAGMKNENKYVKWQRSFDNSSQKIEIIDSFLVEAKKVVLQDSLIQSLRIVVDEFFTNAVYNAPLASPSTEISPQPRKENVVQMSKGNLGRMVMGYDQNKMVIGCEDSYGSLNLSDLMIRIKNCYDLGLDKVINFDSQGGAGIGTFMVIDICTSFYAAVNPGKKTWVLAAVPYTLSGKKRQEIGKNIHLVNCKVGD